MLHFLLSLAAFIVALAILITVHEFGHFLVARCCGVTVERFSIGFGPILWRKYDTHGTEYAIAAIPLGGYIKMLDETISTVETTCHHGSFNQKAPWERAAIVVAGPIFNLLFAVFSYWIAFIIGIPGYRPIIGEVIPNSIAAKAKITPGMELKSIDNIKTPDWDSIRLQLISKIGSDKTTFCVKKSGSTQNEQKTLDLHEWQFKQTQQDIIVSLGITPLRPRIEPILSKIQTNSAAMKAGFQNGDKIVKINNHQVTNWELFANKVRNNPGQPLQVKIERQGKEINIVLFPDKKITKKEKIKGFAGVSPSIIPIPSKYKTLHQYGPLVALTHTIEKIWQLIRVTISMSGKLVTGNIKLNNLSGPLSIAQGAGVSAQHGLIYYLMFLALISVNLGIINLFPLPALDGGHLLFLIIEQLKGKALSKRVQDFSYRLGFIFLIILMSLALFNDLLRIW